MQLIAEEFWNVYVGASPTPIPIDHVAKAQLENALGDPACEVVYFIDMFDASHIAARKDIRHLEYSNPHIRSAAIAHSAALHSIYSEQFKFIASDDTI